MGNIYFPSVTEDILLPISAFRRLPGTIEVFLLNSSYWLGLTLTKFTCYVILKACTGCCSQVLRYISPCVNGLEKSSSLEPKRWRWSLKHGPWQSSIGAVGSGGVKVIGALTGTLPAAAGDVKGLWWFTGDHCLQVKSGQEDPLQ